MVNALIIGVGYVGTALAKFWKGKFSVEGTTTKQERIPELLTFCDHASLLKGNDINQIKNAVKGKEIIVVCVAPKYTPGATLDYRTTYLETSLNLREAIANAKNSTYLLYTSSTSVYNKNSSTPLIESVAEFSENPDQKILKETEDNYLSLLPFMPVCVLRLSQIIGHAPRDFHSTAKMMSGRAFPTSGEEFPNVIHLNDIVNGITFAFQNQMTGIYNLSHQLRLPRKQIFSEICQELNLPPVQFNSSKNKDSHVNSAPIVSDKIQNAGFCFDKQLYEEIENRFSHRQPS